MKRSNSKELKKLGLRIKNFRLKAPLTQLDLAGKIEVDVRTIQRIEAGEFGFGVDLVFSLAKALNIEPKQLFEE